MRLPDMVRCSDGRGVTAVGPTCYRVYSRSGGRGCRGTWIHDFEYGASGHLTEENRRAGLDELDLQVDGRGRVPQGGIELDIELTEGIGNIAPDGHLP